MGHWVLFNNDNAWRDAGHAHQASPALSSNGNAKREMDGVFKRVPQMVSKAAYVGEKYPDAFDTDEDCLSD